MIASAISAAREERMRPDLEYTPDFTALMFVGVSGDQRRRLAVVVHELHGAGGRGRP